MTRVQDEALLEASQSAQSAEITTPTGMLTTDPIDPDAARPREAGRARDMEAEAKVVVAKAVPKTDRAAVLRAVTVKATTAGKR